ncbi:tyrosine-protein phosphatase [Thalassobacillus sp. CUG 92003]|uniref:tyrosine-protein phosphatase n=1 Tax=Thalassobacillus sp. CUG 92003 TaxID=2736641 RepID=UPI0015E75846|nr:CpsB/CapC family capsule biosynthesis tyrosine phosphatase [Thalassobacillus sp. CUG 92003]
MIDIHSHILPGVDDGAATIDDSLAMAKSAIEDGIDTIVATPHHCNGQYNNYKRDIMKRLYELNNALNQANLPLTILPGQETRIHGDMTQALEDDDILSINNTNTYVFVELPSDQVPRYTKQLLFNILRQGYMPIIVHPERNAKLVKEPHLLYEFVQNGAFTQVTAASVCGHFGKNVKKFSQQLIEANLAHVIATDAHNTTSRGFCLSEAYQSIETEYGAAVSYFFHENAKFVVEGEMLAADSPQPIKRKRGLLGLFR